MHKPYLTIPGIYVLFSLAWIIGSDTLAHSMVRLPQDALWIQLVKGTGFVLASGLLIFYLVRRYMGALGERNRRLEETLAEREVIIQEVHHRVKNNLQVVVSLLSMQAARVDENASRALRESENRVRSIAKAHNLIYRSGSFSSVDMHTYITELVGGMRSTFLQDGEVKVSVDAEHVDIPMSHAVPLGLILSELVTNSAKYALADGKGEIAIRFAADHDLKLEYSDSGPGLPPGFDPADSDGLGFTIVRVLTDQLHGKMEIIDSPGLGLRFTFAKELPAD